MVNDEAGERNCDNRIWRLGLADRERAGTGSSMLVRLQ